MADNITAPNGAVLATDDIGGVHHPKTKIEFGGNDTATQVSASDPLPVIDAASASADRIFAINPSDTTALAVIPRALFVTVAGNLAVRGTDATPVTIPVSAGQIVPLRARFVMATNTTASVVGLA